MNKKKLALLVALILTLIMVAGCGGSAAKDKFTGRWISPPAKAMQVNLILDIATKDGKTFGLTITNAATGKVLNKDTATLKENFLEINPLERITINPDGKILFRSVEYTKQK